MYRVVIETWVEPGWECSDGCCYEPPEQKWTVVEANIPWRSEYWYRICYDWEYYRQWHNESHLLSELLEDKVDRDVLDKALRESEEPKAKFKKMLAELGVEVEIVNLDEGEENV